MYSHAREEAAAHDPTVYVSNLPYEATGPQILDLFEGEGVECTHVEVLKKG